MSKKKYLFIFASSLILVCYQNFGPLNLEDQKTLERMREMQKLQRQPASLGIATPQSGSDLASVSGDWMQRQGHLLLNGRDKEILDTINHRLSTWFDSVTAGESPAADTQGGRKPASLEAPAAFRFSRVNEMEYRAQDAIFSCSLNFDGAHLDYSHKLSSNTHLGVDHWTGKNQTQVLLKYNW
ncbi:MAG: hypothetical protein J7501_00040 [Bdellovibrio sp.]|nr:hypothetical protein [Bdellovibrio sp.]